MNSTNPNDTLHDKNKAQKPRTIISLALLCSVIVVFINYHTNPNKKSTNSSEMGTAAQTYSLNEVNAVLNSQLKGWNDGNIDTFMEGYIKDSTVRFITNKRVKTSWNEILASYKKGYPTKEEMGRLTFHRDEVRWVNETAGISQVIGRWEVVQKHKNTDIIGSIGKAVQPALAANTQLYDTLSGRFSLIFVGTTKGPKIQIDHTW